MKKIMGKIVMTLVVASVQLFARAELVDITAAVRASGSGNYNTTGSSSGDQNYQKPGAAFNGKENDRFYMTYMPRLCFNIQSGFSQGKDIVLKKYVITQTGNSATDRIPSKWSLYGSADGGATYTIPLDVDRAVTPADIEIVSTTSYRITVEIPDNEYPINAYRFTFSGAMHANGSANTTITIGEVYLWGEIRETAGQIFYEAEGYEGPSDGFAHGITVKPFLPDPATVKVEYSASEDGPWSETQPVISRPCAAMPVYFRLSVPDDETYRTVVDSRTVTLRKEAFNLTALVRERGSADDKTYFATATDADESRVNSKHEVMWDGKWPGHNGSNNRWYNCSWLTYVLDNAFLPDSNFVLRRYNLRCGSDTQASRRPVSWKIYGSRDGVSYDYLVDEQTGRAWTDEDNKQLDGSYLMTIELPDNRRAYRAYKFACSNPSSKLEMAEIEYFAERVDNGKSVDYTVTNFEGVYSGFTRTIDVAVTEPAEGATIRWALAEEGPYADVKPVFVRPCNQRVWFEITADGYMPHRDFGTVKIAKLPKEPVDIVSYLRDPQLPGAPLFTVSSKKAIRAGAVANLFNGKTEDAGDGDRWFVQSVSGTSPADVVWTSSDAYCPGCRFYLTSYEIWGGGTYWADRRPTAWTLEGSKTGEEGSWVTLDTKTGVTWVSTERNKTFACVTEDGYRHFRILFTASGNITLCEIKLNGLIYKPTGLMLLLR